MPRISKKHAKKLGIEVEEDKSNKNKYNNKKPNYDGITFDSKKEAKYYLELKLRKKAGDIKDFKLQPEFVLLDPDQDHVTGRGIKYRADFKIINNDDSVEIIDVKGYKTSVYKIKKKLLLAAYPKINFKEV